MNGGSDRVAALDVGCFSAHLLVASPGPGSGLRSLVSHKVRLRLDRSTDEDGRIDKSGINGIAKAVAEIQHRLREVDVATFLPFATSSVRDATNAEQVITTVAKRTGMQLRVLSGEREARLSYLAARHWFRRSPTPLSVLDVGGGTVELAVGSEPRPQFAYSMPLGARTLSRAGLNSADGLGEARAELLDRVMAALPRDVLAELAARPAVGCSTVFNQLAVLTGAARHSGTRRLRLADLQEWIPRLAVLTPRQRAALPGISRHRARQSLAGAVIAEVLMKATGHETVDVCPWSTTEGVLLNLLKKTARS